MVAEDAAPVGVAGAVPGGAVAVAVLAAWVGLALRAQRPAPPRPATGTNIATVTDEFRNGSFP